MRPGADGGVTAGAGATVGVDVGAGVGAAVLAAGAGSGCELDAGVDAGGGSSPQVDAKRTARSTRMTASRPAMTIPVVRFINLCLSLLTAVHARIAKVDSRPVSWYGAGSTREGTLPQERRKVCAWPAQLALPLCQRLANLLEIRADGVTSCLGDHPHPSPLPLTGEGIFAG